jgi:hypothetical protein
MSHRLIASLSLATALMAEPALAEWRHAAAPMGQFEGGVALEGDTAGIGYGCADSYGTLEFYAKGIHVAAGESVIRIDGQEVARGNTQYNSVPDLTRFSLNVQRSYGPGGWTQYNAAINALASGTEAVWETPTGETFSFSLDGSAKIRSCLMN